MRLQANIPSDRPINDAVVAQNIQTQNTQSREAATRAVTPPPAGLLTADGAKSPLAQGLAAPKVQTLRPQAQSPEKTFIVFFDDSAKLNAFNNMATTDQSPEMQVLSNPETGRIVKALDSREQAWLTENGIRFIENQPVSLPPIPELVEDGPSEPGTLTNNNRITHGADKLHEQGFTGKGIFWADIDTGIAPHPDLNPPAKFDDVFTPAPSDPQKDGHGHGTHVNGTAAGTGASKTDNAVLGMAPDATVWGAKVLSDSGSGSFASVLKGVERVIEWAKEVDAPVVASMSLGGRASRKPEDDPIVQAIEKATKEHGIMFVIAAGNSGPWKGTVGTPGIAPSAVTVAAMDTKGTPDMADDEIARFSSRGNPDDTSRGQAGKPDIAAGGVKIHSTLPGGKYAAWSGTSMATPAVSGAAALLLQKAYEMDQRGELKVGWRDLVKQGEIANLLYETAIDNEEVDEATEGAGNMRVDLAAALLEKRFGSGGGDKALGQFKDYVSWLHGDDGIIDAEESQSIAPRLGTLVKDLDWDTQKKVFDGVRAFFVENPTILTQMAAIDAQRVRTELHEAAMAHLDSYIGLDFDTEKAMAFFKSGVEWHHFNDQSFVGDRRAIEGLVETVVGRLPEYDARKAFLETSSTYVRKDLVSRMHQPDRAAILSKLVDAVFDR